MRHSPRMGKTFEDSKRRTYVERRYLKREHRRYNKTHAPVGLKEFAVRAAKGERMLEPKPGTSEVQSVVRNLFEVKSFASKPERLRYEAEQWLKRKATKQVKTVHPKRVKTKKSDVKIKAPTDDSGKKKRR